MNYKTEFDEIFLDNKVTPLTLACFLGKTDIIKLILSSQTIDVDLGTEDCNYTPLIISCF